MKRVRELDEARKLAKELNELILLAKTKKAAFERRFPLYSWWPGYYSPVIASGGCNVMYAHAW